MRAKLSSPGSHGCASRGPGATDASCSAPTRVAWPSRKCAVARRTTRRTPPAVQLCAFAMILAQWALRLPITPGAATTAGTQYGGRASLSHRAEWMLYGLVIVHRVRWAAPPPESMQASTACTMTLDVYADLFDEDLDAVAVNLRNARRAALKGSAWRCLEAGERASAQTTFHRHRPESRKPHSKVRVSAVKIYLDRHEATQRQLRLLASVHGTRIRPCGRCTVGTWHPVHGILSLHTDRPSIPSRAPAGSLVPAVRPQPEVAFHQPTFFSRP